MFIIQVKTLSMYACARLCLNIVYKIFHGVLFVLNYNTNFEILIIKKNIDSSEKRKTVPEIKYYREHHIKKS